MDHDLEKFLEQCVERDASDLHLSSNNPVYLRLNGDLQPIAGGETLSDDAIQEIAYSLLTAEKRREFDENGRADVAFSLGNGTRFRGHIYREQHGLSLAVRKLEDRFRSLEELGLPQSLAELCRLKDGLILFTGPTGSGKSTTLATLIDDINQRRPCHILTIEEPIEYIHANRRSLVHQREVGRDVESFALAVRDSLREDPDVVLVGEMRDVDTMRATVVVAETGHLVFSTLHCGSAVGALDRLIGAFPAHERQSLCQQLSMTLRAVVAQHLLPRADGNGRVVAVEILRVNAAAAHMIRNYKSEQIRTVIESGARDGMQTLDQSLAELVVAETVDPDVAAVLADSTDSLQQRIDALKLRIAGAAGRRRR